MILVIDNYDSFTFNLVHYLIELGADVRVERNDALTAADALSSGADAILIIVALLLLIWRWRKLEPTASV